MNIYLPCWQWVKNTRQNSSQKSLPKSLLLRECHLPLFPRAQPSQAPSDHRLLSNTEPHSGKGTVYLFGSCPQLLTGLQASNLLSCNVFRTQRLLVGVSWTPSRWNFVTRILDYLVAGWLLSTSTHAYLIKYCLQKTSIRAPKQQSSKVSGLLYVWRC